MEQPHKQTSIIWKDLSAQINGKQILQQSHGYCLPGQMLAIMGPSGAGKTTLLSLISKKVNSNLLVQGQVLANNTPFDPQSFYNFGAFVYQNDLLHDTLTVRETLEFISNLKIKNEVQRVQRVKELILQFQLQKCEYSYVGGSTKKSISGGEKKRVCIAVQMVTKPSVLILDEPTSGLDSSKAAKVLRILKKLASENRTIIFTLHQPSFIQFNLLNNLILLNKGLTIYQGKASEIEHYMSKTLQIAVPNNRTISDFFMMEISDYKIQKHSEGKYQTKLNHQNYCKYLGQDVNKCIEQTIDQEQNAFPGRNKEQMAGFMVMLKVLLSRQVKIFTRNPMRIGSMLMNSIVRLVIVGLLFLDEVPSRQFLSKIPFYDYLVGAFRGIQAVVFINIASNFIPSIYAIALTFPVQRDIYCKETISKKYTALPYLISKILLEWLSLFVGIMIYTSGGYWLNGYTNDLQHYFYFSIAMLAMGMSGDAIGMLSGTIFSDVEKVTSLTPIILMPMMAFSGMFNKLSAIPPWISWMHYLSPFHYGLQMQLVNQFRNQKFTAVFDQQVYDYRTDIGIQFTFWENLYFLIGLSFTFYALSFAFLMRLSQKNNIAA